MRRDADRRVTWGPDAYAGFWRRVAGHVVDSLLLLAVAVTILTVLELLGVIALPDQDPAAEPGAAEALVLLAVLAGWGAYRVIMTATFGWTLGKRAVGIEVRCADGTVPGPGRAFARLCARLLSYLPLRLGFLWAAWDPRKQTWHDRLVGCYVLRTARLTDPGGSDPNLEAVRRAGLGPEESAWLAGVAAQVDERLDRVDPSWRASAQAEAARACAFGLLLGHLAGAYPHMRDSLDRTAEAHPSFSALLSGSRLATLERIAAQPAQMAAWLGPLLEVDDPEHVGRLLQAR